MAGLAAEAEVREDLFDGVAGDPSHQRAVIRERYRRLAKDLHPDRGGDEAAFKRLGELYRRALAAVASGAYGADARLRITSRNGEYAVGALVASGDIVNTYNCTLAGRVLWIRVSRIPRDNDLVAAESNALRRMRSNKDDLALRPFVPELIDSFTFKDGSTLRRANVVEPLVGFHTLEGVRKRYPEGLDPRDMAWMFRRLLAALGYAHGNGVIHGAVLPCHVSIHAEEHGVVLTDWQFSSVEGRKIVAVKKGYRDFYPADLLAKDAPANGMDLHMAAKTCLWLLGANAPVQYRAFFKGCMLSPRRRPNDAWGLLSEFDELIERLHGPRRFRKFSMA